MVFTGRHWVRLARGAHAIRQGRAPVKGRQLSAGCLSSDIETFENGRQDDSEVLQSISQQLSHRKLKLTQVYSGKVRASASILPRPVIALLGCKLVVSSYNENHSKEAFPKLKLLNLGVQHFSLFFFGLFTAAYSAVTGIPQFAGGVIMNCIVHRHQFHVMPDVGVNTICARFHRQIVRCADIGNKTTVRSLSLVHDEFLRLLVALVGYERIETLMPEVQTTAS